MVRHGLLTFAVALLLAACGGLGQDRFPSFISWVAAERDLSGVISADPRDVRLETVTIGDGTRVFSVLGIRDSAGPRNVVLFDANLNSVGVESEADFIRLDSRLFVTLDGRVQLGTFVYNPELGELTNDAGPGDVQRSDRSPILHDGFTYWIIEIESAGHVTLRSSSQFFVPQGTVGPREAFTDGAEIRDLYAHFVYPDDGGLTDAAFFLEREEGVFFLRSPVSGLSEGVPFPVDPDAAVRLARRVRAETARSTPAGVFAASDDALYRFDASTGEVLDSYRLGENPRTGRPYPVVFDPAGEFCLIFDAANRTLYELEAWW